VTEFSREDGSVTAQIEYPIKTMNIHPERRRFQVDTGPVLLPDLSSSREHVIEWFQLAYTIYNRFDRAEFIKLVPSSLNSEDRSTQVMDYSEVQKMNVTNRLFAEIAY